MSRQFRTIIFFLIGFLANSCQNDGSEKSIENNKLNNSSTVLYEEPAISFDTTVCDFGRVYEGETVGWYFRYVNVGSKNLVLLNVTAGCGCTVPTYSKEPIAPGKSGEIKVVFDTKGRLGHQDKTVTVETNGNPKTTELSITAEVIKK